MQEGLREQFHDGLLRSRYYVPTMERIFRNAGMPPELVTLAHVESGFHGGSRSSAGAVGIWQFTRDTGKHYMKITRYHDDRLNPERETLAAAKLLRSNYDTLGDWPLAITAYNYGTGGVARAAGIYGGDYSEMVQHYQGPHFGFAVKNYYAEFLAALQVHRDEDKYFPGIADEPAIRPAPIKTDFAPTRARSRTRHTSYFRRPPRRPITRRRLSRRKPESGATRYPTHLALPDCLRAARVCYRLGDATQGRAIAAACRPRQRLKDRLGNDRLAQSALAAVRDRAPDDQLALAFLTKLAENSAAALKDVLRDRAAGADLIFCLGSSELVATELSLAGPEWAEIFLGRARADDRRTGRRDARRNASRSTRPIARPPPPRSGDSCAA